MEVQDFSIENEASCMAVLQHLPNFLKLYGAFWDTDRGLHRYNLVMELADESLNARIKKWDSENTNQDFRERKASIAVYPLIRAMCQVNEKNISHRDIKPDNIFIVKGVYKIAYFGMSKNFERIHHAITITNVQGDIAGILKYIAPEFRVLESSHESPVNINYNKADVFSLGLTMLRMITKANENALNVPGDYLQSRIYKTLEDNLRDSKLKAILGKMLTVKYQDRPKFAELLQQL